MSRSSQNKLHLIAFNIPFPADNGGLIDVFCKIKTLKQAGVDIILHCYEYGREHAPELHAYCEKIYYYKRETGKSLLFKNQPYIVAGRKSSELVKTLKTDDYPILFEGLHCCGILDHSDLKNRIKIVRTHNVEHDYYRGLASAEPNLFKRYYFSNEAGKLEQFESILKHADAILSISAADTAYFSEKYPEVPVTHVSAFHLNDEVHIEPGGSDFALYHGSLEVAENNYAALKLVKEVFNTLPYKLVIAGKNPSKELREACVASDNVCLKYKITTPEIQDLVSRAHINILPTWQSTGIKLKLLLALFSGRHCIVNTPMVKGTGLESLCRIADTPDDMRKAVGELFSQKFTEENINHRKTILENGFSNRSGAEKIKQILLKKQIA